MNPTATGVRDRSRRWSQNRALRIFIAALAIMVATAPPLIAERRWTIGTQHDFSFGAANQAAFTSTRLRSDVSPFVGYYPALAVRSTGRNTEFDISYTGLAERFSGKEKLNTFSHDAGVGFTARSGRSFRLRLAGAFSTAPDYTSLEVLKGVAPDPSVFEFVFQPVARSRQQTVRGGVGMEIGLTERSQLLVDLSGHSRKYLDTIAPTPLLMDQVRSSGALGWRRTLNAHDSIDVEYVFVQNDYRSYGKGRSSAAVIGYTRRLSPNLEMRVEAGPARISFSRMSSRYGYAAAAYMTKTIGSQSFAAHYEHRPGDSSGLGSISNLHSAGVSLFSPLRKRIDIAASFLFFRSRPFEGGRSSRGLYGSADLSYPLSRRWFVIWGGSFRTNSYGDPDDRTFKRLYMSFRFRAPELWRTSL